MAVCTSITWLKDKLIGDPLDIEMFRFTHWIIEESAHIEDEDNIL